MPYTNRRRQNNDSNEWNLSPAKEGSSKKKREEQGLKSKRDETSYEEAPCFKRRKEKKRG
jgi:hypothetical protein